METWLLFISRIDTWYALLFFFLAMIADVTPMIFEVPPSSKSCPKAIILVCTFLTYYLRLWFCFPNYIWLLYIEGLFDVFCVLGYKWVRFFGAIMNFQTLSFHIWLYDSTLVYFLHKKHGLINDNKKDQLIWLSLLALVSCVSAWFFISFLPPLLYLFISTIVFCRTFSIFYGLIWWLVPWQEGL